LLVVSPRQVIGALGVAFALALASIGFAACGGSSGSSQEELDRARKEGVAEARQQAKIEKIEGQLKALKNGQANGTTTTPSGGSGSGASGPASCGGDVSVGHATTCEFARDVEAEYRTTIGSGSGTIYAYSPATGRTYAMYCTAGEPHICTGGNEASVYFP
jgi:hypothetical protein